MIYLRSFAIWLLNWSYIGHNLVVRSCVTCHMGLKFHLGQAAEITLVALASGLYLAMPVLTRK